MISFDVGDGSGGNVDLSPIYKTLQILNLNTESIWNYVTNMTGTTTLSIPYLETYRTQDEMYMYNITGDLTNINYSGNKIVRGFMDSVYQKSLYALDLDIEYIESMRSCTFDGGTWNNAISLRGGWFAYDDFHGNGRVSIKANVLVHNIFSSIKSLSVNALNLHTVLSGEANSFVEINYFDLNCNTIKNPLIIASELNLKCREMYGGGIFGGIYHNVNAMSISNVILSQIENLNMTGQSMNSCALLAFDFCNLQYNIMASNQILTASDLNINCRLASDILLKSINNLDFNVNSLYSLYISHCDMVKLNFYSANSISIECPNNPCDIALNGKSLDLMTVSNPSVLIHGSIKTLVAAKFSDGRVDLTCDLLYMCSLTGVRGVISAKTVSLCDLSVCHDLTIYGDLFIGDVQKGWEINLYCETLGACTFYRVQTMFLSFDNLYSGTGRPYIDECYNLTFYHDLQDIVSMTSKPFALSQGQNWLGTLYLKSGIREAAFSLANLSLVGITITQDYDVSNCPVMCNYISAIY